MKLSVLTTSFNSQATIRHTVDSFLAQDYRYKEMLVLDGASRDRTIEIIESYNAPEIQIFSEKDSGLYDALNKGLQKYTGDALGVLNSDDRFHDNQSLQRIAEGLAAFDMIHGDLDFVQNHITGTVVRRWRAEPRPSTGFRSGWMPAHPTFYVTRKVVESVGAFNLSYATSSDYDWMLRATELNHFSLGTLHGPIVDMMIGGRSTASIYSHFKHNYESLKSRRAWLGAGVIDYATIAKPVRKINQLVMNHKREKTQ